MIANVSEESVALLFPPDVDIMGVCQDPTDKETLANGIVLQPNYQDDAGTRFQVPTANNFLYTEVIITRDRQVYAKTRLGVADLDCQFLHKGRRVFPFLSLSTTPGITGDLFRASFVGGESACEGSGCERCIRVIKQFRHKVWQM